MVYSFVIKNDMKIKCTHVRTTLSEFKHKNEEPLLFLQSICKILEHSNFRFFIRQNSKSCSSIHCTFTKLLYMINIFCHSLHLLTRLYCFQGNYINNCLTINRFIIPFLLVVCTFVSKSFPFAVMGMTDVHKDKRKYW